MYKHIKFFIKNILRITLGFILSLFIKRDKNIILLSTRNAFINKIEDYFLHNTKYLFLKSSQFNIKSIWLCNNKKMIKEFNKRGYKNVYPRNSLKGIYYSLKAKYCFSDYGCTFVNNPIWFYGINSINLWHGIPLKKIGFDDMNMFNHRKLNKIIHKLWKILRVKDSYYIVNSKYEQACYESAFYLNKENIKILCSPRLDVLLHDIPNAEMFMEEDFNNIKSFKAQGKKIFIYMPTFRETGKDISGWLKSDKLKEFLHNNNAILVCKLHPFDKNSLDSDLVEDFYKMASDSDIYPVLKYSDALITDYSSIYFDYLLLDKPILYYPIDLEEYQEKCRGFYRPYDDLTAGVKAYNEDELVSAMNDVINGVDNYKEKRKLLRDKMFKYQDGKNCERVVEWVRSLDK